ncbi:tagatose-bisphosphate aldolase [Enterococcus quebecensis]|uniref:Tagatose 1,6-diphosphate aldolase n=1 Tax=Enterococcus quebecensis TaxID=903983 RepID=A0A1E5GSW8_9ENTE|nr:tagatose-bisphosphate aldolase [Enterococcus quebecensis]OEG15787.1 tagatose-bisphosphate aldolase [Enterococcus quebecensis]OJG73632.1 tagatose 1,6-diphosphate aldolase 2 [Enterococcus quebecensis]
MLKLSSAKKAAMDRLSTDNGIIEALAIDQRGALKKMIQSLGENPTDQHIIDFKKIVSKELTPYASAILLDPEYGIPAAKVRDEQAGLLLAYEKTGYDAKTPGRLPDLLEDWSVERLKENGADAVKFLLYYDIDEPEEINHLKHVFIERLGSECFGEDLPFYLELVSYDAKLTDASSSEYAKIKPEKVIKMMKEFSKPQYKVDVLKVEVPVNMNYVEGIGSEQAVYSRSEALAYFKQQSDATHLPFIFLSAGVSAELFQETLLFAKEAGSTFNGVLCGRATWKEGVAPFVENGEEAGCQWLRTEGKEHIQQLNKVIEKTASSWHDKVEVID